MDPYFVTLSGVTVSLGTAAHAPPRSEPPRVQRDAFFGVPGQLALAGGGLGRTWSVSGVLAADNIQDLITLQVNIMALVEASTAGTFNDTQGNAWPYCYLESGPEWRQEGPVITDFGWIYPFANLQIRALQ